MGQQSHPFPVLLDGKSLNVKVTGSGGSPREKNQAQMDYTLQRRKCKSPWGHGP